MDPYFETTEERHVWVECPQCGTQQEDLDGFGVLHCDYCGYCTHPSATGTGHPDDPLVCDMCGARV